MQINAWEIWHVLNESLHLIPSSRARLGSLPWALCVRTLHRPFRSSRHSDISFIRGPASFRHDPGATLNVSSPARLCGDTNTALHTRSCVALQDGAFKGSFISNDEIQWSSGSSHSPLSPSNALTVTKNVSVKCCSVGRTFRKCNVWWLSWTIVSPDADYQRNTFLFLKAPNQKQAFVKTGQNAEAWEVG